jgi:hypothetical protein
LLLEEIGHEFGSVARETVKSYVDAMLLQQGQSTRAAEGVDLAVPDTLIARLGAQLNDRVRLAAAFRDKALPEAIGDGVQAIAACEQIVRECLMQDHRINPHFSLSKKGPEIILS